MAERLFQSKGTNTHRSSGSHEGLERHRKIKRERERERRGRTAEGMSENERRTPHAARCHTVHPAREGTHHALPHRARRAAPSTQCYIQDTFRAKDNL